MRKVLAILTGKLISLLSRTFKLGGGSAAPGLYALKIDPNLVEKLADKIPTNIVITGTNGKTSTARMLTHFAKNAGLKVIRNHTGSNLERGIASTLISATNLVGLVRPTYEVNLGIWELDEAAFNTVAPKLKPDMIVFLNVFRDQLDRYGEVDTVVKNWSNTLKSLKPSLREASQTIVLVNGDDANTAKLKNFSKGEFLQFGVKDYKILGESIAHTKESDNLDYEAKNVKLNGLKGSSFKLLINHKQSCPFSYEKRKSYFINLPLPGIYHIYDFLAAFALGHELGFASKSMIKSLKTFQPAFGRVEKLPFGYIFLIKNPAGATQVFETIAPQLKPQDRLLLALNDNIADGTDVSWIWDANFEKLRNSSRAKSRDLSLHVSGTRADDLANRLKYAGFDPKHIIVQPELKKALQQAKKSLKGRLFILPTYTAMLELQRIFTKSGIKKHYWEET